MLILFKHFMLLIINVDIILKIHGDLFLILI
jgi:hypothetical protein